MPTASAVREVDIPLQSEESTRREGRVRREGTPPSEQMRYQPRFRVVTRKPLPAVVAARVNPIQRAWLLAAFPGLCLLVYVLFWTLAARGGYYRAQLRQQVDLTLVEQRELRAEKLRLQSPGYILQRAEKELGMRPPQATLYSRLPVPQRLAQGEIQR